MNSVLIASLTRLGGAALFVIEVDGNAVVVAIETLARPEEESATERNVCSGEDCLPGKLVAVPDPQVDRFTQSCLDCPGVEDLPQQDTLGVV